MGGAEVLGIAGGQIKGGIRPKDHSATVVGPVHGDFIQDGDVSYVIAADATTSMDPAFNGLNVDDNPIEFDKSRDDSQISILEDEVAQILKVIEKHYKVEPIECLECGGKDVLVVAHTCTIDLAIQSED